MLPMVHLISRLAILAYLSLFKSACLSFCLNCLLNNWYRTMFYLCLLTLSLTTALLLGAETHHSVCIPLLHLLPMHRFFFILPLFLLFAFDSIGSVLPLALKCTQWGQSKLPTISSKPFWACLAWQSIVITAQFNLFEIYLSTNEHTHTINEAFCWAFHHKWKHF